MSGLKSLLIIIFEISCQPMTGFKYFMFMVPCIILYSMNNQQMQLYAVNFIPLLGSLYMFRAFYTPIIRSTIF